MICSFGLGHALDDLTMIRAVTRVFLENSTTSAVLRHQHEHRLHSQLMPIQTSIQAPGMFSPLAYDLPPNVHILSLQLLNVPADDATRYATTAQVPYVLRLQHLYEVGEHPVYSQNVTVNVSSVFSNSGLVSTLTEMALTASETLSAMQSRRLQWMTSDAPSSVNSASGDDLLQWPFLVTLAPREIRTFIVNIGTS